MSKHLKHLAFIRYLLKRFYYARKRKKALAIIVFIVINSILTHTYTKTFVHPNTYLGIRNISGYTRPAISMYMDSLVSVPFTVRVANREYEYSLEDMGIIIDHDKVLSEIYAKNNRPFPADILSLIPAVFTRTHVDIPLVYTQDYIDFIDRTVFDFSDQSDEVIFDKQNKSLEYVENEEKYRIDDMQFRKLLASRIEHHAIPLYPKLAKVSNGKATYVKNVSERIKAIFLQPLTVYVQTGSLMKSFVLTERQLADIARVDWSDEDSEATISVNTATAIYILNEQVKKTGVLANGNIATQRVLSDLEHTLTGRFNGQNTLAMTIHIDKGPNTDGTIAKNYVEVDISQQKMYLFKNNRLHREFRVSTGLEYPTPVGEFTILNKAGLGFSNIYDVWMPWWMGFKYSDELHAYFGIHEIPYKLTDQNIKLQPSNNAYLDKPNTGGCIALGVGDAKYVYQFADIGMKVAIFN